MILIYIFSIFGLSFLIKESDGPFGIMATIRNKLMQNKYCGVFFYKLLDCFFCVGCHAGWIIYLLQMDHFRFQDFILWSLAGGAISMTMNAAVSNLNN
jgi:hypothetical protein